MPIIDPKAIELEKPELFFGFVAAIGTPLSYIESILREELTSREYDLELIRLSDFLKDEFICLASPLPPENHSEYDRVNYMMDRGNELREITGGGEILALLGINEINRTRPPNDYHIHLEGKAFLFSQLKHPDEVFWLRKIYGSSFHLIGVYCSENDRNSNLLIHKNMSEEQAKFLIERDLGENDPFGQHLRDTFYLSDVFIKIKRDDDDKETKKQLSRYLKLLFGEDIVTPNKDEYGMHLAYSTSLRSADLSRQVGAAILNNKNDLISLGCNEAPAPHGGQYWEDDINDARDFKLGQDENEVIKREIVKEIFNEIIITPDDFSDSEKDELFDAFEDRLKRTRLMNLTEFGRSVHAEMEAIISPSRKGIPLIDCTLYVTTFPCHNCTKHIICAGIKRLVYIEPYPKSLAKELHGDAIQLVDEDSHSDNSLVNYEPFVGVAPRMYSNLFSIKSPFGDRIKRKLKGGKVNIEPRGLKIFATPFSYIDREHIAARVIKEIEGILYGEG